MFITSAYAQNAGTAAASGSTDMIMQIGPFAAIAVIFYLLVFRPMEKQKKTQESLVSSLKKGDEVATTGGLIGKISKLEDLEVTLEIADGVKVRVLRSTVSGLYGATTTKSK